MNWLKKYMLIILLSVVGLLLLINIIIHYWNGWSFTIVGSTLFNNLITPIATIFSIGIYTWTLWELIKQNRINHSNNLKPYFDRRFSFVMDRLKDKIYSIDEFKPVTLDINQIENIYFDSISILKYFKNSEHRILNDPNYKYDLNSFKAGKVFTSDVYENQTYIRHYIKFMDLFSNHGISGYIWVIELIKEVKPSSLIDVDKKGFLNLIRFEMVDPYITYIDSIRLTRDYFMIPRITMPDKDNFVQFEPFFKTAISDHYEYFLTELYPERQVKV